MCGQIILIGIFRDVTELLNDTRDDSVDDCAQNETWSSLSSPRRVRVVFHTNDLFLALTEGIYHLFELRNRNDQHPVVIFGVINDGVVGFNTSSRNTTKTFTTITTSSAR